LFKFRFALESSRFSPAIELKKVSRYNVLKVVQSEGEEKSLMLLNLPFLFMVFETQNF